MMNLQTTLKTHPSRLFWLGLVAGLLIGLLLGYQSFKQISENGQNALLKSSKTTINSYGTQENGY